MPRAIPGARARRGSHGAQSSRESNMADPVGVLHPRKLYAMLRACPSADARAEAALEFVRECAGSEVGVLLLSRGGELAVAASTADSTLPPGLLEATRTWNREQATQANDDRTKTVDESARQALRSLSERPSWKGPTGEVFERCMLSIHRGTRWVRLGMVVLKVAEGRALSQIRHFHVEALW